MANEQQPERVIVPKDDQQLIKDTFYENDEALKAMRAVMLGINPTDDDRVLCAQLFNSGDLYRIVKQRFLPELDRNAPIGVIADAWKGIAQFIHGSQDHVINQSVAYRKLVIEWTDKALKALRDANADTPDINVSPGMDPWEIRLLAHDMYILHVENQLVMLKAIAQQVAQQNMDKTADSAK